MDIAKALNLGLVGAFLLPFATAASRAADETPTMAERPKVAVAAADVTLDGKSRPDVAEAITDTLSAGLLKRGDFRVFHSIGEPKQPARVKGKGRKDLQLGAGAAKPDEAEVDYLFQFNVLGQDDDYRFTIKKIRTSNKEVMEVHELAASGTLEKVFALLPAVLDKINPKPVAKGHPVITMRHPSSTLGGLRVARSAPVPSPSQPSRDVTWWPGSSHDPYAGIDFSKVPKALTYQRVGSIQMINDAWKFCIIRPASPLKLALRDSLHVLYDEDGKVYANLRVANFDGGAVIADYGATPGHHRLFAGDAVFGWAPPIQ